MDDLAIVLYRTGNVKGWLFCYGVCFRNAAPFETGAIAVLWSTFRCQRNPAKISRDAALAQRRPTVVSASAQCLGDPQRHGRDLRKKMNVMKKPRPSKAEERQPRRLPGFIGEMEVDWPMPSCVRPLQLGSGRATDAEAVPQCSWNGSAALGRPTGFGASSANFVAMKSRRIPRHTLV
jgi:hypothetical protein